MRFARTGSAGLLGISPQQSHQHVPVLYRVRPTRASSSLQASNLGASKTQATGKWPWVFKYPGRCVDLPAEEVFSGFEGLLLDDVSDTDSHEEDDRAYSKVRVSLIPSVCVFVDVFRKVGRCGTLCGQLGTAVNAPVHASTYIVYCLRCCSRTGIAGSEKRMLYLCVS